MSATLSTEVLNDELAVSLARVIAASNKRAEESGVDVQHSIISITQVDSEASQWRINYGPRNYVTQRGGDLLVEVNAADATVTKVLRGQ